jgi:hypothetical protein
LNIKNMRGPGFRHGIELMGFQDWPKSLLERLHKAISVHSICRWTAQCAVGISWLNSHQRSSSETTIADKHATH